MAGRENHVPKSGMGLVFVHIPLPHGQEQLCKMAQKETSKEEVALV